MTKVNGQLSSETDVPQDSTLGPLLDVGLYIDGIPLVMYFYSSDLDTLINTINRELSNLGWFNSNSLKLKWFKNNISGICCGLHSFI